MIAVLLASVINCSPVAGSIIPTNDAFMPKVIQACLDLDKRLEELADEERQAKDPAVTRREFMDKRKALTVREKEIK